MMKNTPSGREIVSTRLIPFTREEIFRAWTDPSLLAQWWGPGGFTNTFREFDLRPGGSWRFTMHAPNGDDFENECVFVEIANPGRIVFDHLEPVHWFRLTATFEPQGEKTLLTFHMLFETAEEVERIRQYVVPANEQNLDRLEAVLAKTRN
jgi:uncharacterized protein YndB with AHSA1/START domain